MNLKNPKRIVLKLSGEAVAKEHGMGIDFNILESIAIEIKKATELGFEIAIVIGGGNFWRGRSSQDMDRSTADYMGMLATVINSLALQSTIENLGIPTRVMSAIEMNKIAEPYLRRRELSFFQREQEILSSQRTRQLH